MTRCEKCWDDQVVWVRTPAGTAVEIACPACAGAVSATGHIPDTAIPLLAAAAPASSKPKAFEDLQVGDEIALRFTVTAIEPPKTAWRQVDVKSSSGINGHLNKELYEETLVDTELARFRDRARVRRYVDEQPADETELVLYRRPHWPSGAWLTCEAGSLVRMDVPTKLLWCHLPDFIYPPT